MPVTQPERSQDPLLLASGRADVCARLRAMEPDLRRRKVTSLSLFGSVARDEACEDSDVDVMVTTQRPFTLLNLAALHRHLEERLGRTVDIVDTRKVHPATPENALRPRLREALLRDLFRVF